MVSTSVLYRYRTAARRIFVALDYPNINQAFEMINLLIELGLRFKIGLQLLSLMGWKDLIKINRLCNGAFFDFKLYDISQTITNAVHNIAQIKPAFVTIIGEPHIMRAALIGQLEHQQRSYHHNDMCLVSVTVLTSLDKADLEENGYDCDVNTLSIRRAKQAYDIGIRGLICSPHEVTHIRQILGKSMCLITPGIRPAGSKLDDQKRTMTPIESLNAGANYLVIGRPITKSSDPYATARDIVIEIANAGY